MDFIIKLDEKDRKIIEVLKEHGDYTTRKIADKTLLPITTVHNRVKKLKREKIIKKFTIELDPIKTNMNFIVYVLVSANLQLLKEKKKTQHDLARELRKFPFVERADIVSGEADIITILKVKDVEEFDKVLLQNLQLLEGVEKTRSFIVINRQ